MLIKRFKQGVLLFTVAVFCFASCKPKDAAEKEGPAPLVDMKNFFKNGEKSTMRISPDGNYFSTVQTTGAK